MEADAVCQSLMERLSACHMDARVHSVFRSTLNLSTTQGVVALLFCGAAIQPLSIRLCGEKPDAFLSIDERLLIEQSGIYNMDGGLVAGLLNAKRVSLRVEPKAADTGVYGELIRDFLLKRKDVCLSPLIDGERNAYAELLEPRFNALRRAVLDDDEDAASLAARCAGCGVGLTPSSDDLLAGYLATLYALEALSISRLRELCLAAAARTNEISASILSRLGEGLVSEHLLTLLNKICGGISIADAMQKVAGIGSTSGGDILTGVYFGLLDYECKKVII